MKEMTQIFKALSDETRLRIMSLLVNDKELCVCDIMEALHLPQSKASRHLSYLRNAGLVDDRRHGVWIYYKINRERLEHASVVFHLLSVIFGGLDQTAKDRRSLKEYLATKKPDSCN